MSYIKNIARLLTEDPDVFRKNVVLAVHPNYVVDAVVFASTDKDYGPQRLQMLKNYIDRFKRFIDGQISSGSTVIITMIGDAMQLDTWYDPRNHYEDEGQVDPVKMGMEQEEVGSLHQDLKDYIHEKASLPNVYVVSERLAGDACRTGKLDDMLEGADELSVVGGHLTGCLSRTVEMLRKRPDGPEVSIITELTFDDDENFWKRASADYFNQS